MSSNTKTTSKVDKNSSRTGKAFWGPPTWFLIHVLATALQPKNSEAYKTFLHSLTKLLPCIRECRTNLKLKLQILPPDDYMKNREDAFFYSYTLHDMANQQISIAHPDTPKDSPNYDKIRNYYFDGLSEEGNEFWENHMWFVMHALATTLRPEDALAYKQFLFSVAKLAPCENMKKILENSLKTMPPDAYLSNNHDAFFYSYVLHDIANSKCNIPENSQNYDDMKSYYFRALFQECNECSV